MEMDIDAEEALDEGRAATPDGDSATTNTLLAEVYDALRSLAQARLRALPPGQTLQPTALVHEAYLRLTRNGGTRWNGKGHFFGAAALAMRQILVDAARRKKARKRGGDQPHVSLDDIDLAVEVPADELLAVDEAVRRLEEIDPRKGEIVNLRYFAQLSAKDTAAALGISTATLRREWRFIRTWLQTELDPDEGGPGANSGRDGIRGAETGPE